jgi:hypothetical protein
MKIKLNEVMYNDKFGYNFGQTMKKRSIGPKIKHLLILTLHIGQLITLSSGCISFKNCEGHSSFYCCKE